MMGWRGQVVGRILGSVVLVTPCWGEGMEGAYNQGISLAQGTAKPSPSDPGIVPGYQGAEVPQTQLAEHDLSERAVKASKNDEASQLISGTFEKRERFVIDPHTDPLFKAANEVISNPQQALGESLTEMEEKGEATDELKTCEEGGEEYIQKCSKWLQIVLKVTPATIRTVYYCPGHTVFQELGWHFETRKCGGCQSTTVPVPKDVKVESEQWVDDCTALEDLSDKGLCRYVEKSISPQNETRTIQGESVTRDHFEEHFQYACLKTSAKSCAGLREQGCWQVKSVCKEEIDGRCVLWEQTYQCPSGQIGGRTWRSSSKDSPFCLGGDCTSKLYAPNTDFANVMAQLSVFKEAQNDIRSQLPVFKGEDKRCTRDCLGFRDCCGNGKGWGVSVKMASCGAEEKKLAKLREKGRCIQIGTYCDKKVLGQCVSKKTTFCCYNSRLAKVIQEQGRHQLGLGRGDPKEPRCEGLSIEQLSQLDFSRINFAEAFGDIMANAKVPQGQKITQDIQKSMADRGSLMNVHSRPPPTRQEQLATTYTMQGRGHGQF